MSAELNELRRKNDFLTHRLYRLELLLEHYRKQIQEQDTKICEYEFCELEKELNQ